MKTQSRLENAIYKLYNAFNENTLNPECCIQCAVGNILDNTESWKHLTQWHGSTQLSYVGKVHEILGRKFNGYSPLELLRIETVFLEGCGYKLPFKGKGRIKKKVDASKNDTLFNGLSETIKFLCALDHSPNVMEYTSVFRAVKENKTLSEKSVGKNLVLAYH